MLDGGWWPHSRNPIAELPVLVTALTGRGVVTRLTLGSGWSPAPESLTVDAHIVLVEQAAAQDPNLIVAMSETGDRLELLVVPPGVSMTRAAAALAVAADPTNTLGASDILRGLAIESSGSGT